MYYEVWDQETDNPISSENVRWKRAMRWRSTVYFKRTEAVPLAVTAEAHAILQRLRARITSVEKTLTGMANTEKTEKWPADRSWAWLKQLWVQFEDFGLHPGDPEFIACDRAASKQLARLRMACNAGKPLTQPGLATIRLKGEIAIAERDGVQWPTLPLISLCRMDGKLAGIDAAEYSEVAMIHKVWWVRFVFVSESPFAKSEKARSDTAILPPVWNEL